MFRKKWLGLPAKQLRTVSFEPEFKEEEFSTSISKLKVDRFTSRYEYCKTVQNMFWKECIIDQSMRRNRDCIKEHVDIFYKCMVNKKS